MSGTSVGIRLIYCGAPMVFSGGSTPTPAEFSVPLRLAIPTVLRAWDEPLLKRWLVTGGVGFIGLAVPQALRLAGVHRHRALAPLAALLGGGLLVAADTLARTVARPLELPVGAITALLGVPILLLLIARSR